MHTLSLYTDNMAQGGVPYRSAAGAALAQTPAYGTPGGVWSSSSVSDTFQALTHSS